MTYPRGFMEGKTAIAATVINVLSLCATFGQYKSVSGIYPHLSMWNSEGECGTGAVVPWAGKLWTLTYGPHVVFNSDDRLYEIDEKLNVKIRKESLGGTHANRMVHDASNQLIIGCYFIDDNGKVRAIPRSKMPGRLTGTARSQTDDKNKVYFATMEEGLYEVDVNSLDVNEIIRDGNLKAYADNSKPAKSKLHGYHGKGFYAGFGKLFYSNNGVHHNDVGKDPTLKSGALASWSLGDKDWSPIRICQFTEITGKYGISGSDMPEKSPIWALGFDCKSVILMLCENGVWSSFRLPKASHSYDGSHGWNTEWPRIRDIGEQNYLMTMHGAFWSFPPEFNSKNLDGIRMRSNYLKVVGDFCEWKGKIVLGCDDSAQKEFFNKRPMKADNCSPEKSNSNLIFLERGQLDSFGTPIGRGSVFLRENVKNGSFSEPMFVGGFDKRILVLSCDNKAPLYIKIHSLKNSTDSVSVKSVSLSKESPKFIILPNDSTEWIKLEVLGNAENLTAHFNLSNAAKQYGNASDIFNPIARIEDGAENAALMRSTADQTLALVSFKRDESGKLAENGTYRLDKNLDLRKSEIDEKTEKSILSTMIEPKGVSFDKGSVLVVEDGKRYRLPLNRKFAKQTPFARAAREVSTERDLFNCGGTFYELPARNAQGFAKIRPIASHDFAIFDYASYCGIMFVSGLTNSAELKNSEHVIVSDDKELALWAGSIDDLWQLGKPTGEGDVWQNANVRSGETSDPFLLTGYDKKTVRIKSKDDIKVAVEIDVDGTGLWVQYDIFEIKGGKLFEKTMNDDFVGYWVRFKPLGNSNSITATLLYQ